MTGISVRAPGMSSFGGIQFFSVVGDTLFYYISQNSDISRRLFKETRNPRKSMGLP